MARDRVSRNQELLLQVFKGVVNSTMLNMDDASTAILLAGGLALSGGGVSAQAGTFDFGSLANGAADAQKQSLMKSSLPAGDSVTVTGAVASNSYNADRYVAAPLVNGFFRLDTLAALDPSGHSSASGNPMWRRTARAVGSYNTSYTTLLPADSLAKSWRRSFSGRTVDMAVSSISASKDPAGGIFWAV